MRIGIYFRESDPRGGGGFTFEQALLEVLLEQKRTLDLTFLGPEGAWLDRASAAGCSTVRIPISGSRRAWLKLPRPGKTAAVSITQGRRPPRSATGLDRLVATSGVDVLWCLGPDVPTTEIPFLMTVWDLQHRLQPFFPEVSKDGLWARRERYFTRTIPRATYVITGTRVGRDEVTRFYGVPDDRVLVLPHPTPGFPRATESDEDILRRLGLEPGYLLYPAQFWPHKNHVTLLRALRLLVNDDPDTRLVLVGSDWGGNQSYVRNQVKELRLEANVTSLGFVERAELAALYRGALALTYPSLFGPENLPPVEAFSLGCPVIAANVSGAAEQLGGAALLVPPTDEQALAHAVATLRDQGPDNQLIEAGRRRAGDRTPAMFVDQVLKRLEHFRRIRRTWA